jgi:hypothetical protein
MVEMALGVASSDIMADWMSDMVDWISAAMAVTIK